MPSLIPIYHGDLFISKTQALKNIHIETATQDCIYSLENRPLVLNPLVPLIFFCPLSLLVSQPSLSLTLSCKGRYLRNVESNKAATSSDLYKCCYVGQVFSLPQGPKLMSIRGHWQETQMNTIKNLEVHSSDIYTLNRHC